MPFFKHARPPPGKANIQLVHVPFIGYATIFIPDVLLHVEKISGWLRETGLGDILIPFRCAGPSLRWCWSTAAIFPRNDSELTRRQNMFLQNITDW